MPVYMIADIKVTDVTFLYALVFVEGLVVPNTIDSGGFEGAPHQ